MPGARSSLNYLLDTCLISEVARPRPEGKVIEWLAAQRDGALFLSVLTLGEIEKGAAKLQDAERAERIRRWLREDLQLRFTGRILPINQEVAVRWGRLAGEARRGQRTLPVMDGLLAATALVFDLVVVTRNVTDLQAAGARVLCPWI